MLEAKYGGISPLLVHRSPVYDYLGIALGLSQQFKVFFIMIDYIKNIVKEFSV